MSAPAPDLLLGADDDLATAFGDLVLSGGAQAVAQAARATCRFFRGEWYADEDVGIPYWTDILGEKNPNLTAIRAVFRTALLATPGIATVPTIQLALAGSTREGSLTFSAYGDDGALLVTDSLQVAL